MPLSPMDEMGWFLTPVETFFTGVTANMLVAKANPNRVVLIFSAGATTQQGGALATLSTSPNAAVAQGIQLTPTQPNYTLRQKVDGPLCQSAWYVTPSMPGGNFTVLELILRDWPVSMYRRP